MPINTEIEDKKTEINFNRKNNLLHSSITFPFYPDLGKNLYVWTKNGNLDFPGGEGRGGNLQLRIWTLGKSVKFGFSRGGGNLQLRIWTLGKKCEIWIFQGGVICNSECGLREKVGNLDFPEGGVICNFGFGL